MPSTDFNAPSEERLHFGTVALVLAHDYGRLVIIANPDYSAVDMDTCLAELNYRYGAVGATGKPEWDQEQVWVWDLPIPTAV